MEAVGSTDCCYSKQILFTPWFCICTKAVQVTWPRGQSLEAPDRERFIDLSYTTTGAIQGPHRCSLLALYAPDGLRAGPVFLSETVGEALSVINC